MSEQAPVTQPPRERPEGFNAWAAGWAGFAGIMLILLGSVSCIAGISAIADENWTLESGEWIFEFSVSAWGWIHLIVGIVVILAGVSVLSGKVFGRVVGIIVAGVSALSNFAALPHYPIWSVVKIAIAVIVIWALTAHGEDVNEL